MSRDLVTVSDIFACGTSMSFFCNSDKAYNLGWGGVVYLALPVATQIAAGDFSGQ